MQRLATSAVGAAETSAMLKAAAATAAANIAIYPIREPLIRLIQEMLILYPSAPAFLQPVRKDERSVKARQNPGSTRRIAFVFRKGSKQYSFLISEPLKLKEGVGCEQQKCPGRVLQRHPKQNYELRQIKRVPHKGVRPGGHQTPRLGQNTD